MIGLVHTVMFQRAIGVPTQLIQDVSCQYFKATYVPILQNQYHLIIVDEINRSANGNKNRKRVGEFKQKT